MQAPAYAVIERISGNRYVDKRTGEVKECRAATNRAGNKAGVAQSLRNLRDIINANLTDSGKVLWVTLTYKANMTVPKRLYEDFRRFWQRLRYYLHKRGYPSVQYIAAAEPQGRGAWHIHCLLLFPDKAPFIPNSQMARIWRHGFTKTKSLKFIDNPGLYLTAYLGNMELGEAIRLGVKHGQLGTAETVDEQGRRQQKAIIKGARLHLYPAGFNLYRCSRGIKRPEVYQTTEAAAQAIIGNAPLVYEKTITVSNAAGAIQNTINYRQYNRARKEGTRIDNDGDRESAYISENHLDY